MASHKEMCSRSKNFRNHPTHVLSILHLQLKRNEISRSYLTAGSTVPAEAICHWLAAAEGPSGASIAAGIAHVVDAVGIGETEGTPVGLVDPSVACAPVPVLQG